MMKTKYLGLLGVAASLFAACNSANKSDKTADTVHATTDVDTLNLPSPDTTASKNNFSKVIDWPANKMPVAPEGFVVSKFADGMKSPRNIVIAPNGDILVALSNSERSTKEKIANAISGKAKSEVGGKSVNTIMLFRDSNKDGKPELTTFLSDLNQPYGMAFIGNSFYVANTDGLWMFPYKTGDTKITGEGKKIVSLLQVATIITGLETY
ncbi:hypothetical protein [Pedobacter sp. SL55]|uniref:hypothetical protein n=1 Tax=Pedobacter sp. SL55 TaxID=2995161 RepID=UPI00226F90E0|nr:hypothetical protein [Pedobacter sp. SL55]WAC42121.1 hypothetical protein OVA16_07145 [Pedobacter sp. SL55]